MEEAIHPARLYAQLYERFMDEKDKKRALSYLRWLADNIPGQLRDLLDHRDFDKLRETPEFKKIVEGLSAPKTDT